MIDRNIIFTALMVTALTALIGGCQSADDGYPVIGRIQPPRADFLTPEQQQADRRRLEAAKAAHHARSRRAAR